MVILERNQNVGPRRPRRKDEIILLTTLQEVLKIAEDTGTAIPAFNIDNLEGPEALVEAGEAENCPLILTL